MADLGGIIGSFLGGAGGSVENVMLRKIQDELDTKKAQTLEAARHANNVAMAGVNSEHRKAENIQADELKRAPAKAAAAEIAKANAPVMVEDGVGGGMPQAPTVAEQRANERKAYMASGDTGLIQAAITSEGHDIQREGQARQERQSDKQLASHESLQKAMRESQERITGMHASIQKEIANMGSTIQVLEDGTMATVGKDGKVKDYVRDPSTGEKLTSKKNVSEGDRALMISLTAENKGQEAIMKDSMSSPEQRAAASAQIKSNTAELYKIAGREQPKLEYPKPSAVDQADAAKRASDPKFMAAYAAKFGDQAAAAVAPTAKKEPGQAPVSTPSVAPEKPIIATVRAAGGETPKPQSDSSKAYEAALQNSFLTKVAQTVGAGTVDFTTAVGKLGYDWEHYHKTGELKRKFSTQGMTPVGDSLYR